jgi:hypothetical protein
MSAAWKRQLEEDVDLVCWWHECTPAEKAEVIDIVRADLPIAIPCFRAMAGEVHRAITFG